MGAETVVGWSVALKEGGGYVLAVVLAVALIAVVRAYLARQQEFDDERKKTNEAVEKRLLNERTIYEEKMEAIRNQLVTLITKQTELTAAASASLKDNTDQLAALRSDLQGR